MLELALCLFVFVFALPQLFAAVQSESLIGFRLLHQVGYCTPIHFVW